jgi:hypothetical protein
MVQSQIVSVPIPFYGLTNLIAGITPTYIGWNTDPTDGADITDGDLTTICNTGSKTLTAGYQYGVFEWTFPECYVITGGIGSSNADAGTERTYILMYDGTDWTRNSLYTNNYSGNKQPMMACSGLCSGVRLALTSTAPCTMTPDIRNFNVWKVA